MPLILRCDRVLIWTILSLTLFGLLMVYSATAASEGSASLQIAKQLIAAGLGFAAMYALTFQDYRSLRNPQVVYSVLGVAVVLLALAAVLGTGANTRRFLRLGVLSLQPSELAKPAGILYLAYYLGRNSERIHELRALVQPVAVVGGLAVLILIGQDFGTMAALAVVAATMLFLGGVRLRYMLLAILPALPVLYAVVWRVPYRKERLLVFLNPEADSLGGGFQILQSLYAVGSGGWLGQGWMVGKQKMDFLPEAHTDFMFALVGEELGLLGSAALVAAFSLLLWRGLRAAGGAPDLFGVYLAAGITTMIASQAMLNMGVVLGLLPTKGMPLPFISYGGSSLMTVLASSGVLLNISRFGKQ